MGSFFCDDAHLTSGLSREQRGHKKTKIGTEVAHITCDSDTTFKVKRSKVNWQGHIVAASRTAGFTFTFKTDGEIMLKIGHHLAKLWARVSCFFLYILLYKGAETTVSVPLRYHQLTTTINLIVRDEATIIATYRECRHLLSRHRTEAKRSFLPRNRRR